MSLDAPAAEHGRFTWHSISASADMLHLDGMKVIWCEPDASAGMLHLNDMEVTWRMKCVQGGFSYSGQRCTAVKVVLVMEEVADELVKKVNKGVDELTVGMPEVLLPSTPPPLPN